MTLRLRHEHTDWSGLAAQYLVGTHHKVRRLRLHVGHHDLMLLAVPKGVKVTTYR